METRGRLIGLLPDRECMEYSRRRSPFSHACILLSLYDRARSYHIFIVGYS